jgi:hypothetical protein
MNTLTTFSKIILLGDRGCNDHLGDCDNSKEKIGREHCNCELGWVAVELGR